MTLRMTTSALGNTRGLILRHTGCKWKEMAMFVSRSVLPVQQVKMLYTFAVFTVFIHPTVISSV